NNTGLLLIAASQAFFSLMNVAVKKLNGIDPPVSTLELIAVRMGITYICSIAYMLSTGVQDPFLGPKGVRLLLILRGFTGFFGLFGIYYSLEYLSLSDATVLTFLAPMCTAIAGALLLGEKFTRREAIAGLVSLVGVVLIARPTAIFGNVHVPEVPTIGDGVTSAPMDSAEKGTPRDRLIAVGVALLGVLGATGAYTSIRAVGKRAHPLHSLTFFSTLCVFVAIPGMIITKTPIVVPNRLEWLTLLAMIGLFGFFAQILLTMGLQRETAGRGSMAIYTQVVFATILERIFFKTAPTVLSVSGTLLILASATYVAVS
ncbi:drug/metabolite transporter superfamily, partial [Pholiota molesta]